jgi:UDP-glucose 4-epimerase
MYDGNGWMFSLDSCGFSEIFIGDSISMDQTNLNGSINVLDAVCGENTPVFYASSTAVYGDNAGPLLKEQDRLRPLTAYGADKVGCELHARVAAMAHDLSTSSYSFKVYGPRQSLAFPHSGVVSVFIDRLLQRKAVHTYVDGE